jgi:hypothetical protein
MKIHGTAKNKAIQHSIENTHRGRFPPGVVRVASLLGASAAHSGTAVCDITLLGIPGGSDR